MEVVIVTGASRGLGAALAAAYLAPDRRVIGVARTANPALESRARAANCWLDYYLEDLADPEATDRLARSVCDALPADATRLILINNAGMLDPVGQLVDMPLAALIAALNVNVAAAMVFTARFLKATAQFPGERRVVNISSGAARNPYDGWSVYCTTKAALDMHSRCVKVEEAKHPNPARIVSLAPGVIDTAMQTQVRASDRAQFPGVARFIELKETGQLVSADDAARRILEFVGRESFGEREIEDLRTIAPAPVSPPVPSSDAPESRNA